MKLLQAVPMIKICLQKFIIKISGIIIVSAIIVPAQAQDDTNSCPVPTHSNVSFTVSESIGRQVLSGTFFGMRDSDRDIIAYLLDGHLRGYYGPLLVFVIKVHLPRVEFSTLRLLMMLLAFLIMKQHLFLMMIAGGIK